MEQKQIGNLSLNASPLNKEAVISGMKKILEKKAYTFEKGSSMAIVLEGLHSVGVLYSIEYKHVSKYLYSYFDISYGEPIDNWAIFLTWMHIQVKVLENELHNENAKSINPQALPEENNVLAAGFRSVSEQNRFAKLISIASVYQQDQDWEEGVKESVKANCQKEADRLKFPFGWQSIGSYEGLKLWFFKNCR